MNTKEKRKPTVAKEPQGRQRSHEARANDPKGDEEKGEPHVTTHGPRKQTRDRQEKRRGMEAEPQEKRQTRRKKKETKKAKPIAKIGQ